MRRFVVSGIFLIVAIAYALAQKPFTLLDTILIEEVVSFGEIKKYQSGVKIEKIETKFIELDQQGGIENLLKRFSPIYIKSDAGGIATIRFRGTSPNHTSINFGGINLNSLTLGHSNLSTIPAFLFDEISLQYGSSSAVNGSGAIGGALYLGLSENWTQTFKLNLQTMVGSFGETFAGTKIFAGNGKWESVTRAYYYFKENNFPFTNTFTGKIEYKNGVEDIQNGASVKNFGVLQEINYRFHKNEFFKSLVWFENSWRQVQPNMQTNFYYTGTPEVDNKNIRIWSEYNNRRNLLQVKAGLGFVHDNQVFDGLKEQLIQTDRLVAEFQGTLDFVNGIGIKSGFKYKYIVPNVHAYSDSVIQSEQHFDLFFSMFYQVTGNLKASLNLRQNYVTNFKSPFTPSVGGEYNLRTGDMSYLGISTSLAKSFRVPTLNDRYWGIQGNPDLKPETGNNFEAGVKYVYIDNKCTSEIGINAFYMLVENWIEWRNFGIWRARNVQEVVSKGIEFQLKNCLSIENINVEFGANYTYNPVVAIQSNDQTGMLFQQLNYVPKHMMNSYFNLEFKSWQFFADGTYTGTRTTNDFGDRLQGYFLLNTAITRKLLLKNHSFNLNFSVNNLLNNNYQNEKYYAMPGRFFRLGVKYDISFNNL